MNEYEQFQQLVRQRVRINKPRFIEVHLSHARYMFYSLFLIEWWAQYHCYQATPVAVIDTRPYKVALHVEPEWGRLIKRYFLQEFGIRHVAGLKQKDNAARIDALTRMQYLSAPAP